MTSLEARLAFLELQVGKLNIASTSTSTSKKQNKNDDTLNSRLEALQTSATTVLPSNLRDVWKESLKLLEELDPGMALTHQQQPLLYRRQQVLAAAESLELDFQELAKIQHALGGSTSSSAFMTPKKGSSLGGTAGGGSNITTSISSDKITQAPILTDYPTLDTERLEKLIVQIVNLQERTQALVVQMDRMLEVYHQCMTAASEKIIVAEETITDIEKKRVTV